MRSGAGAQAPTISVLLPIYQQAAFVRRALDSLLAQTFADWELLIVDDGSTDGSSALVASLVDGQRVRVWRLPRNRGLGAALNFALARARGQYIAYLPADDLYFPEHLATLHAALATAPAVVLAYAGVRHHYNREAPGQIPGYPLQLVQVLHRRTSDCWVERGELVTDDLDRLYWARLRMRGAFVGTGCVTCAWSDHPLQHHKLLREPEGGLNRYRAYYGVAEPLRLHTTQGNPIDEVALYARFRERHYPPAPDGLRILLVGELAYNPERVLALAERGHRLYGLWIDEPYWYNTVGPLPFGHVVDLPRKGWQDAIRRLRPDVIYALLNWQAAPLAHAVQCAFPDLPFVWHFKEGPFICLQRGTWPQLVDLYTRADAQVFSSPEMRDWWATVVPEGCDDRPVLVLDGDLPKREWLTGARASRLLSAEDGALHTVVPGRPIGLHPETVAALAAEDIHLHVYGDFTHGQWRDWIARVRELVPRHLHLHGHVHQDRWVTEFSRYDAGWLHVYPSRNGGDLRRAIWDDLNLPARLPLLLAAGLPLIQWDNEGAAVATQTLARALEVGVFFRDAAELRARLQDAALMARLRAHAWERRPQFTFDYHVERLEQVFRQVISRRAARRDGASPARARDARRRLQQ